MSSGFSYPQPIFTSPIYNPAFYLSLDASGYLTYDYAQTLYLDKNDYRMTYITGITQGTATQGIALVPGINNDISGIGALSCSSLTVNGSSVSSPPSYVVGITPGTAANNKALILGASGEITTIASLTATNIYGSALSLTSPTAGFQTLLSAVNSSSSVSCQIQVGSSETFIGNSSNHNLVIMGNGSRLITCLPGGNIAVGGTTTTYKLGVNGTINCTNLYRSDVICDLPLIQGIITLGTAYGSKALTCNSTLDTVGINSLTATTLIADTISKVGTQTMTATTLNLNPTTLQIRGTTLSATATELNALSGLTATSTELNYNDITTLGSFQTSKAMTLDASGRGVMPLGSADSNCLRYSSGTSFRESINLYRATDTSGLIIGTQTTGVSTSKAYPILRLISTTDPANLGTGSGVSATTNDLLRIDWNDKPTSGFVSQTHRLCFDIGNTRPYYTAAGYPHTFGLSTSANALSLSVNSSSAIPTSNCIYLVDDTINKLLYNTNAAYTNASYGTANITLNSGNLYIKASNDLNGNSSVYDMPLMMESSHATPVAFAVELHNGSFGTSTNAAFIGTLTASDLAFMCGNNRRMTLTSAGRLGIGTGTPVAPLQVSTNISYTWNSSGAVGTTVSRLRTDSGNTETATGVAITYTNVTAIFNGYIGCEAMVMQSDRRLKQDIVDVPIGRVECLYKTLSVKSYHWKAQPDKFKELGLIAQDVLDQGFIDLVAKIPDSDPQLEQSNDPWLEPKGVKLHVDYSKLAVYNMRMIQSLMGRIEELEAKMATLI